MAEPSPTVYSYYSPEIRNVVQDTLFALNVGSQTIHDVLKQNYEPGLDDLHLPLMEKYESFARAEGVIGLERFSEKYFTNGSSEAIFHLLARARTNGVPVYVLDGEYQGYAKFAEALGVDFRVLNDWTNANSVPTGIVFMSNPASQDGNIVRPAILNHIRQYHYVVLDLAYMGMTRKPLNLDLTDGRIIAVVGSLSKPFGLYYYRIGFCYSNDPVPSLYGNKWFKNALSIKIGEAVLDDATPKKMATFKEKYFSLQERAVRELNNNERLNLDNRLAGAGLRRAKGSDVWLLAESPLMSFESAPLKPFKRGEQNYRFCLTPFYMEYENA